ncbi:MAG: symmetrical bis(5'-nucleosyl)-tetraphosphatase [Myxococcota bacterium]|nr:symmetrical bis(5'-nucleosyl)-tetraphosphatase [Myxococcota bacterium]
MATYIIGDVQGCFATFQRLLAFVQFQPQRDRVYLLGDLVNRGPDSLSMLRWAKSHDAVCVLGNHDLYCLHTYSGGARRVGDTLSDVLAAPDVDDLMDWLRRRPFAWFDETCVLVHAGFQPDWNVEQAMAIATAATRRLSGPDWKAVCLTMSNTDSADDGVSTLTQIRMCNPSGEPDYRYKGAPEAAPKHLSPWFEGSSIGTPTRPVFFGHWAALGHRNLGSVISMDTGCVWGRTLSAYRLDDGRVFAVPAVPSDIYSDQ